MEQFSAGYIFAHVQTWEMGGKNCDCEIKLCTYVRTCTNIPALLELVFTFVATRTCACTPYTCIYKYSIHWVSMLEHG